MTFVDLQISREEQVWQNELKDLIWLELQAKLAGRTLAQQDAFLCVQRKIVPTIVQNIRNYRYVSYFHYIVTSHCYSIVDLNL